MENLTLEQAYYVGELVAAIMVIVSMAIQVKQNNTSTRLGTLQAASIGFNRSVIELAACQMGVL